MSDLITQFIIAFSYNSTIQCIKCGLSSKNNSNRLLLKMNKILSPKVPLPLKYKVPY